MGERGLQEGPRRRSVRELKPKTRDSPTNGTSAFINDSHKKEAPLQVSLFISGYPPDTRTRSILWAVRPACQLWQQLVGCYASNGLSRRTRSFSRATARPISPRTRSFSMATARLLLCLDELSPHTRSGSSTASSSRHGTYHRGSSLPSIRGPSPPWTDLSSMSRYRPDVSDR